MRKPNLAGFATPTLRRVAWEIVRLAYLLFALVVSVVVFVCVAGPPVNVGGIGLEWSPLFKAGFAAAAAYCWVAYFIDFTRPERYHQAEDRAVRIPAQRTTDQT